MIISILGSTNSGKTTIACQIAKYLSSNKKNVLLIFSDSITPPLAFISEDNELEEINSIGSIFSSSDINSSIIKKSLTLAKNSNYLAFLGFLKGESEMTYPKVTLDFLNNVYMELEKMFDYIIVDCVSDMNKNELSSLAINKSDLIFRIKEQTLKSITFYKSFENISKFFISEKRVIDILNNYNSEYELHSMFNSINYLLPYCDEVKEQLNQGKMLKKLTSKNGEKYKKEIKKIVEELILS